MPDQLTPEPKKARRAFLTREHAAEYQDMDHHTVAPTHRLEVGIVQRLIDATWTRTLIREQAVLMRLIHASHRDLQTIRKLNPSANPPVSPPRTHRQKTEHPRPRSRSAGNS
jgi:hypothetical protein